MTLNWHTVWGSFFNENAQLIGHDSADVHAWIAANPDYRGAIWINEHDGSEDMEVTEIFFPEPEEITAETVAETAPGNQPIQHERNAA